MLRNLILRSRRAWRFEQDIPITEETLKELIDLVLHSESMFNGRPLKYALCCDPKMNSKIFPLVGFESLSKDGSVLEDGERPSAYIVILLDTMISESPGESLGFAAETILLGAIEKGLGGYMHYDTLRKEELLQVLRISPRFQILLVLSLGVPKGEITSGDVVLPSETGNASHPVEHDC